MAWRTRWCRHTTSNDVPRHHQVARDSLSMHAARDIVHALSFLRKPTIRCSYSTLAAMVSCGRHSIRSRPPMLPRDRSPCFSLRRHGHSTETPRVLSVCRDHPGHVTHNSALVVLVPVAHVTHRANHRSTPRHAGINKSNRSCRPWLDPYRAPDHGFPARQSTNNRVAELRSPIYTRPPASHRCTKLTYNPSAS